MITGSTIEERVGHPVPAAMTTPIPAARGHLRRRAAKSGTRGGGTSRLVEGLACHRAVSIRTQETVFGLSDVSTELISVSQRLKIRWCVTPVCEQALLCRQRFAIQVKERSFKVKIPLEFSVNEWFESVISHAY